MREQKIKSELNEQFLILYCLGIIFIVDGHTSQFLSLLNKFIPYYSFHIPLFSFCSGYFSEKNLSKSFAQLVLHKTKKLLVPFFFWNTFYGFACQLLKAADIISFGMPLSFYSLVILPLKRGTGFGFNSPSWYVPSHLIIELVSYYPAQILQRYGQLAHLLYFSITLLACILAIELAMAGYDVNRGWWVLFDRVAFLLPFYSAGIIYRKFLEPYDYKSEAMFFLIHYAFTILYSLFFGSIHGYSLASCSNFHSVHKPIISAFLGILFWLHISHLLIPLLKHNAFVFEIGTHTFSIMMHHMTGFFLLTQIWRFLDFLGYIQGFDISSAKRRLFYIYLPHRNELFSSLYILFGLGTSFLIDYLGKTIIKTLKKSVSSTSKTEDSFNQTF